MKRFFKSVSIRLSLRFMIVLSAAVLVLSIAFVGLIHSFIRSEQNAELLKSADNLEKMFKYFNRSKILRDIEINENSERSDRGRQSIQQIPYYISFVISDLNGNVVRTNDPFLPILGLTDGTTKRLVKKNFFIDGDLNILYFTKMMKHEDKEYLITTSMDMTRESSSALLKSLPKSIMLATLPVLVISFFISFHITSRTMNPVIRITRKASKISSSNLGTERLFPSKHDDEIQDLITTFNNLFDRLKVDFDREKQFTSDVSHELKTPVAVILGQTNLLMRWGKDDPEQLQKSLDSIKKETKSMEAIISNLLQISRIENGKIKPNMEEVKLGEVFTRLQDEFKAISPKTRLTVVDYQLSITSDSELLHQVLTVVVSNSVKYAGECCSIGIFAHVLNQGIVIDIDDDGNGFPDEVLPHVFERFYRGDESHTRSVGGSGLGLSIAKVIVESLGGTISAYNTETHGAGIRIVLPK